MWPEMPAMALAIITAGLASATLLTRPRHAGQATTGAVTTHGTTTDTSPGKNPDRAPGPHPWHPSPTELRLWSTLFRTTGHAPFRPSGAEEKMRRPRYPSDTSNAGGF